MLCIVYLSYQRPLLISPLPMLQLSKQLKNWLHSEISFLVSRANMAEAPGIEERQ